MSVIFDAAAEAAKRTSNIIAGSSDYTCLFYAKNNGAIASAYKTLFITYNGAGTYTNWAGIFSFPDGNVWLDLDNGSGGTGTTSPFNWAEDVWYRFAYVRAGNTQRFYAQAPGGALTLIGSVTVNVSASTFNETWIGDDGAGSGNSELEIAYFREYSNDLTLAELIAEFNATVPVRTTNINGDWPLTADLNDDSGLGHDWTAVGSLTFNAATPVMIPNGARTQAIDLGLTFPIDETQDVLKDGFIYFPWYKITPDFDGVIGIWGYGAIGGYSPRTVMFIGSHTTAFVNNVGGNKPLYFQVTNGESYTFQFDTALFPDPAELSIAVRNFSSTGGARGDIGISDDIRDTEIGFPIAVASPDTNYLIKYYVRGLPSPDEVAIGEFGDVVASGIILIAGIAAEGATLYTNQFVLVGTVFAGSTVVSLSSNHLDAFYVLFASGGNWHVRKIFSDGTIDATVWNLGTTTARTIHSIAVRPDETILYYNIKTETTIKRWDLVNNIALSDLVDTGVALNIIDGLVLTDNTIIYGNSTGGTGTFFRYNAAGTLLNTYNITPSAYVSDGNSDRLARGVNDDTFWHWYKTTNPAVFQQIDPDTGSVLGSVEHNIYVNAVYILTAPASLGDDQYFFGVPQSCPFWIMRAPIGGTGTIIVRKITIPVNGAVEFEFEATNLTPSTFSLFHDGEQQYDDVPAGDEYGIEEVNIPDGWNVGYNVSNGSPIDNISVAEGEEVVVTVINSQGGGGVFKIPTIPTTPSPPSPVGPNTPQTFDDFPDIATGEITPVRIPTPFFVTALIQDK